MKIGILAPLTLAIPPAKYGGTEQVIALLTEGLVAAGHDVTLFASGDSKTSAKLVPTWPTALSREPQTDDPMGRFIYSNSAIVGTVADHLSGFDILHSHIDEHALILSKFTTTPLVTTIHRKMDQPFQRRVYQAYPKVHFVSVSNQQRRLMSGVNWAGTVYNGLDLDKIAYNPHPRGDYLLFVGRISPEKNPVWAIEVAKRAGRRLKLAGKIDQADQDYFAREVKPLLDSYPQAEFLGEVEYSDKIKLYQNAAATIFPIDWEEPFGLVMVESLAAGTPVIATRRGSVPEIIQPGQSGFIGQSIEELATSAGQVGKLQRADCRSRAEDFSVQRMITNYLKVYNKVIKL